MYIIKTLASDIHPYRATPVVLAALEATPGTQIIPSFAVMLTPKSRFRSRILKFTLNFSGLSIILPLFTKPRRQLFRQSSDRSSRDF